MRKKWILMLCITILLGMSIPGYRSHLFFLNFVDEDDNVVIGNYVAQGEKLYSDVFTQHQPILFVLSAAWQKITSPNTIQMVIKRHREFMIGWSAIWLLIVSVRFGWSLFLTGGVLELVQITLLGNLFLAESLVIGPLLYVFAYCQESQKNVRSKKEIWWVVSLGWFIWFSLAPLWPLVAALFLLMVYQSNHKKNVFLAIATVGILMVSVLLPFVGVRAYWVDAIYINYQYYLPLTTNIGLGASLIKAFLAPLFALIYPGSGQLLILIKVLSIGYLVNLYWLIANKKQPRALILFLLLGLCSLRYIEPGNTLYGAFHMLPWFALLTLTTISGMIEQSGKNRLRMGIAITILVATFWTTYMIAHTNLWDHRDPATDYYVHYSPSDDIRTAVTILSENNPQTVWVEPVMYWPYWRTGAKQFSPMVNYYGWMDSTAPLKQELMNELQTSLPTIVWSEGKSLSLTAQLGDYVPLWRDGSPTSLYIRKNLVSSISETTRAKLMYYRFEIP